MDIEIWKDITGYKGLYQVSNFGKIISHKRKKGKILKKCLCNGYEQVCLSSSFGKKTIYVHIIVASHFILNDGIGLEVNHKNGIRNDNRAENLEWVTRSENSIHSYKVLGRVGGNLGHKGARKILLKCLDGIVIEEYNGISDFCKLNGYDQGFISRCCKKGIKGYGFYWKLK